MTCVCGHVRGVHPTDIDIAVARACLADGDEWCGCEGYHPPAMPGEPIVFGTHRLPEDIATEAPAWPPMATVHRRAADRTRRALRG